MLDLEDLEAGTRSDESTESSRTVAALSKVELPDPRTAVGWLYGWSKAVIVIVYGANLGESVGSMVWHDIP